MIPIRFPIGAALLLVQAMGALPPQGQSPPAGTLTVNVTRARNAKGKMGVGLFKSAAGFPEDDSKMVAWQIIDIDPRTLSSRAVFRDLPLGVYAVSARHDENNNGKLDKNFLGIPTEGYGISQNPKPRLRTPTFDEAKFSLKASEQAIEIRLVYR
jgi:uncharacterized protein (DUF2141 family)